MTDRAIHAFIIAERVPQPPWHGSIIGHKEQTICVSGWHICRIIDNTGHTVEKLWKMPCDCAMHRRLIVLSPKELYLLLS